MHAHRWQARLRVHHRRGRPPRPAATMEPRDALRRTRGCRAQVYWRDTTVASIQEQQPCLVTKTRDATSDALKVLSKLLLLICRFNRALAFNLSFTRWSLIYEARKILYIKLVDSVDVGSKQWIGLHLRQKITVIYAI